ncbi:MAG: DUF6796 family protein [Burkholderiales bacterium]
MSASGRLLRGRNLLHAATIAALLASAGDILMLLIASGDAGTRGSPAGGYVLALGGVLGVVAIPLYYPGYQAAASLLGLSPACRRLCTLGAALVAIFGTITHVLTAVDIQAARAAGLDARPPAEAFADLASPLFLMALVAAAGTVIAVVCFAATGFRSQPNAIKLAVLFNPIVSTVLLSAGATVSEWTMAYIAPSAPNLAHVVFFALLARASAFPAKRG